MNEKRLSGSFRFTIRDRALLHSLFEHRYLSTAQIARLHFNGHPGTARRRLRKLMGVGIVDRFTGYQAAQVGFQSWIYRLAREGAAQLAAELGVPTRALLPPHNPPRSLAHLRHLSFLIDFNIWVHEGCLASNGRYRYSLIPYTASIRRNGRRTRRIEIPVGGVHGRLIPDAALAITTPAGTSALFLVEVDCGTEPITGAHSSSIERKMAAYVTAFDQHADDHFAKVFGTTFDGFRVLCLVPNQHRQTQFLEQAEATDLSPLAWVALQPKFDLAGDLSRVIWMSELNGPPLALTE